MTTETLIQEVREKAGVLDNNGEQLLATIVKILQGGEDTSTTQQPSEQIFIGRNITPEEYEALSREEKRRYIADAEKRNKCWVENQFNRLQADWIMVVDGQVVMHGTTLDNYPDDEDFLAFCENTGKFPFAFINPRVFFIEERPTVWHKTNSPYDAYPALTITVSDNTKRFQTEADLDTGAADCYCSSDLLIMNGIIKIKSRNVEYTSEHLSRPFAYFIKPLWLELADPNGISRRWRASIVCVNDWHRSPFTAINRNRTFLLGRRVLLNLRPRLVLDFDNRCTEVRFGEAAS